MTGQAKLAKALAATGIDAFLATSDPAIYYLSGFATNAYERFTGALVLADGGLRLIVPSLDARSAAEHAPGVELRSWSDGDDPLELVIDELRRQGLERGTLGVEELRMPVAWADRIRSALPSLAVENGGEILSGLRARKGPGELVRLKAACVALSRAFDELCDRLHAGLTEVEVAVTLAELIAAAGARVPFQPIVAAGANGAKPHTTAGDRRLERGNIVVADASATDGGYFADITRCFVVGSPSSEQRSVYEIVRRAQEAALEALRPGASGGRVDRAARDVIETHGYGPYFVHRTGHGLGVEVHEAPFLAPGSETVLEEGMVVTVEPGIYLPGSFGIRLEDDAVVTANGCELLTSAGRDLSACGGSAGR
ncbi:MAG: Xaa-Pro peptidase family protein [Gaiellaceae bacterium]